ncbi:hypothetical protein [Microbacterium oxydans]|uniref:hypothetical protein n=1 Tax=Microbacterium oxydans TaxID=82380 RepID=UPI0024AD3A04|nr:hypothetical protein [Microbacterium oxydans]
MIARLEVTRGTLTEYPLAEKTRGGWQNGVTFYPDAEVTKVTPLIVSRACICTPAIAGISDGPNLDCPEHGEPQGEPSSEVPEPRAWHDVAAFLERRGLADGGIADFIRENAPEPQSEPSNRVIVMCARCGLFPVVGGDEINSDIVVCDRCAFAEGRESAQGEPSAAQEAVDRLDQCLANRDAGVGAWSMVRPEDVRTVLAALRAAGVVAQEGESR